MPLDFDSMNETDVREIVIRPLLHRLGYLHGTGATIRTEVPLKYGHSFLGRKKPGRDAEIRGKADYICDVVSHGRLTVEVKAPHESVDGDAVQQAHTYAAHPEVAADFFVVANGVRTVVYRTGWLDAPVLDIQYDELEDRFLELKNVVGAEALKRHTRALAFQKGKPLGDQLAPEIAIIGGSVTYEDHHSGHSLIDHSGINGLCLPVTEGRVFRSEEGNLTAHISLASATPLMGELSDLLGVDSYVFESTDEYLSTDASQPTILQNFEESSTLKGTPMSSPGLGSFPSPFRYDFKAWTEAIGFVDGRVFRGTLNFEYDVSFSEVDPMVAAALAQVLGPLPENLQFNGGGKFEVRLEP